MLKHKYNQWVVCVILRVREGSVENLRYFYLLSITKDIARRDSMDASRIKMVGENIIEVLNEVDGTLKFQPTENIYVYYAEKYCQIL